MFRPWENYSIRIDEGNNDKVCELENYENKEKEINKTNYVNLKWVYRYISDKIYPAECSNRGSRSNFRRLCSSYMVRDGNLYYTETMGRVIFTQDERRIIIKTAHCGSDTSIEASALSSHHGRDTTQRLLRTRYYWPSMSNDVRNFIRNCDAYQKINPATLKILPELKSANVPKQVFKQIGVDIASLPEVDGFKYIVVAIDYFSKWSEAKALTNKSALDVARFLYDEIICRHGCPMIHITDQGREFVNALIAELFRLTGTKQRITTAYHPQANGLVERQNRTVKNSLLKVLQENSNKWPKILQGVLFAHRTTQHFSTGFSPFTILYQREPILPVDIQNKNELNNNDDEEEFDQYNFQILLNKMIEMRNLMEDKVKVNIESAQERQRNSYAKRHIIQHSFKVNDKVLLRNLKRDDRKGGWSSLPWKPNKGYYVIENISSNNTCILKYKGKILKTKHHLKNIKIYHDPENSINQEEDEENKKINVINSDFGHYATHNDEIEYSESSYVEKWTFNAISTLWKKIQCRKFGLTIHQQHNKTISVLKPLAKPSKIIPIFGDGNCFYRAISWWITGSENDHGKIRLELAKFIKNDERVMQFIGGLESYKDHFKNYPIEKIGTWATENEIFSMALMLKTNIFTFSTIHNKWQMFHKSGSLKNTQTDSEKVFIYKTITIIILKSL